MCEDISTSDYELYLFPGDEKKQHIKSCVTLIATPKEERGEEDKY